MLTPWVESGSPSGAPLRGLEVRLVLELPKAPGSRQAALVVYACEVNQENIGKRYSQHHMISCLNLVDLSHTPAPSLPYLPDIHSIVDTLQDSQKPTPFKRHFHRSCVGKEPGSSGRHQGGMTSYFGLFPPDNKTNTKCILSKSFGNFPQNLRLSPLTPSCMFLYEEFRGNMKYYYLSLIVGLLSFSH